MKSSRQRLTHLITKTNQNIPDERDVFGFQGISKSIIVESLQESYDLLANFEEYSSKFETIFLERKLADLIHDANDLLENIEDKSNFNKFLDNVAKIHYRIKEAYIAIAQEPIRTEIEVKKAKEDLAILSGLIQNINPSIEEIKTNKDSSSLFLEDLKQRQSNSIENSKTIDEFLDQITERRDTLEEAEEQILSWKEAIKQIQDNILIRQKEVQEIASNLELNDEKSQKNLDLIKAELFKQEEIIQVNIEQQKEIQKTIEDANRLGMAGSFKKRKDELTWPVRFWTIAAIASITALIVLSIIYLAPLLTGDFELKTLYVKIPIFASCVWLGWFCAKQYGFISRIREDYSYKYAVSMAFEGYKNATLQVDDDLLRSLLELTIFNISKNPILIFDTKNNHGTPYNEIIDNLLKSVLKNKAETK
jgi:hypothetical protein